MKVSRPQIANQGEVQITCPAITIRRDSSVDLCQF